MTETRDGKKPFKRDPEKEMEIRRESRRQRAIERLGCCNPVCVVCGENDPLVLEKHHLEGQTFGNTLVIVCRNCHRKLSDRQKDHPEKIGEPPDKLEATAHYLLGRADLSEQLAKQDRVFAKQLLDRADPNRDNLPEEKL